MEGKILRQGIWLAISDIWDVEYMEKIDNIRTWISIAVGILTAVALIVMNRRKIVKRKKQKELAIRTGKIIKAKCLQVYEEWDTDEQTGYQTVTHHGVYEYTVNGKTKRYNVFSKGGLPRVYLPLYYADSPRKVFSDYDNIHLGYHLACLLGVAAGLLTMYLTSFIFY